MERRERGGGEEGRGERRERRGENPFVPEPPSLPNQQLWKCVQV